MKKCCNQIFRRNQCMCPWRQYTMFRNARACEWSRLWVLLTISCWFRWKSSRGECEKRLHIVDWSSFVFPIFYSFKVNNRQFSSNNRLTVIFKSTFEHCQLIRWCLFKQSELVLWYVDLTGRNVQTNNYQP